MSTIWVTGSRALARMFGLHDWGRRGVRKASWSSSGIVYKHQSAFVTVQRQIPFGNAQYKPDLFLKNANEDTDMEPVDVLQAKVHNSESSVMTLWTIPFAIVNENIIRDGSKSLQVSRFSDWKCQERMGGCKRCKHGL